MNARFLLWALLAFIGAATIALMLNHDAGVTLGLPNSDFGQLAYLLAILVALSSAFFIRAVGPMTLLRAAATWLVIGAVVVASYAYREELATFGGRFLGVLVPGIPVPGRVAGIDDESAVVIGRAGHGHFAVRGAVDGQPVRFLVDTGASFVTLTTDDAERLGYDLEGLRFTMPIRTANGMISAAPIRIGRLSIGDIVRANVPALVAPPQTLQQSLLGLSFLDSLASYTVSGDRLVLSP